MYYIVLGFLVTLILSLLVSLIRGNSDDTNLEPDLFTPLVAKYLRKRTKREETVYMVIY